MSFDFKIWAFGKLFSLCYGRPYYNMWGGFNWRVVDCTYSSGISFITFRYHAIRATKKGGTK
jgi:hypothetical protein